VVIVDGDVVVVVDGSTAALPHDAARQRIVATDSHPRDRLDSFTRSG
jgi:hypothetical protein